MAKIAAESMPTAASRRPDDTTRPDSLSTKFRQRRDVRLRDLISQIAADRSGVRILDLGGTIEYWHRVGIEFLRNASIHVTVLNYMPSEVLRGDSSDHTMFATAVGDACDLADFADGSFDLVHSNSVVEHVGNWTRMKNFAAETRRVGRSYYVQTPYYWFPIDPHYYRAPMIHWMPRPWQARILKSFPVAYCGRSGSLDQSYEILDSTQLIDGQQFAQLFPDADITGERILGLTKSLMAIRRG